MGGLLILLSLCLVSLLSIRQIHSRLLPLEKLQKATRRLRERDLDAVVQLESGDEFEEVASSFNAMARQLKGQIDSMEAEQYLEWIRRMLAAD